MDKLIDLRSYPVKDELSALLKDKTSGKNIIFATDSYANNGEGFGAENEITAAKLGGIDPLAIQPRVTKDAGDQSDRTRKKAEVFTPSWLCARMNNILDEEWFGRKVVFNRITGNEWEINEEKVEFPADKNWMEYVDSRRLEITCGEAPFLVSRYDTVTGELIIPPKKRIGILDRKLRIVNENTDNYDDWVSWTLRAFESCYGFEYQGDNLLIARINFLMTFCDYYEDRWGKKVDDKKLLNKITNIICWNLWQMDGLTDSLPQGVKVAEGHQYSFFESEENEVAGTAMPCKIKDWRAGKTVLYRVK